MELIVPPRISESAAERVQEVSVAAFVATECEGMARVDCFVTEEGDVLVNELNTIPGFTATSVYAKLFEASGIGYPELLDRLIDARARAPRAPLAARVLGGLVRRPGGIRSATASSTFTRRSTGSLAAGAEVRRR